MNSKLEMTVKELVGYLSKQEDDFIIHVQLEQEDDEDAKTDIQT